ncbi:5-histidylcysteine sulfoxide synthase [Aquimarina aggregata]|uniref:5-histidylcysteine sulfoxide synthase n=1 Tax=Aquimarina aggregata TaxID=1642818 RepID=UPI002491850A|nr:5-histidylcysteine sulfoxide synthase [Aquimarina aggregata]
MLTKIRNSPFLGNPLGKIEKKEIRTFFNHTFGLYESLFECLNHDEAFYQRPEVLRHPLIFYYGHTATFFINKLVVSKIIASRVNEFYESLFAVGVDEMSWDDLEEKHINWPKVNDVRIYRKKIQDIVNQVIDDLALGEIVDWNHPAWIVLMGIEHELIHLETSSVLIRQLDIKYIKKNNALWPICKEYSDYTPNNSFVPIDKEKIELGISNPSDYYGWDNEYGNEIQQVKAFKASQFLVSNADYLEFVKDNGYQKDQWWSDEGISWVRFKKAKFPVFWIKDKRQPNGYKQRNMIEEIPLPLNWPVEVNYYEAKAFCNWYSNKKGTPVRLPSEYEWHCIYNQHYKEIKDPEHKRANIHLASFASSCPVDKFKHNKLYDVCGNVWQWTESPIHPFQGFKPHPHYDDFSVPTFDEKHFIIKGGSWISGGNCARKESRYSFRKHFFQHAGFRLVESEFEINQSNTIYENDEISNVYLDAHYGNDYLNHKNFAVGIINFALQFLEENNKKHALDVGCSVGRSSFELSRYFKKVTGVDFSTNFIRYAHQLKKHQTIKYQEVIEGNIVENKSINIKDIQLEGKEKNVQFYQGDACNLPDKLKAFDFVLAANLLDRLYDPVSFLNELPNRMNADAILVITSPFTWKEDFTNKEKWLGGYLHDKKPMYSHQMLKELLSKDFEFLSETQDIPFILKETSRKYQYILPYIGVWKRKP